MSLEDEITSSARAQVNRYHPADDLIGRIEHRRRQRVARRITASGIAAAVLFGGGFLALDSVRDRNGPSPVADSTVVSQVEGTDASTVPPESTSASTTALSEPTTTAPASPTTATTTPQQIAGPPQQTTPPPPDDANVPMPAANPDGAVWVYGQFWDVPRLGAENVRGSGCGSSGEIGAQIPDGLWAGFITGVGGDVVNIDLLCIYSGDAALQAMSAGSAVILNSDPNYLIVNNSTRARAMRMDPSIVLRIGVRNEINQCVDGTTTTQWSDIPTDRQVWIRIHGGRVTWVFADCAPQ